MIFNHEHQHPPSTTKANDAPMWALVACTASLLLVVILVLGGFR